MPGGPKWAKIIPEAHGHRLFNKDLSDKDLEPPYPPPGPTSKLYITHHDSHYVIKSAFFDFTSLVGTLGESRDSAFKLALAREAHKKKLQWSPHDRFALCMRFCHGLVALRISPYRHLGEPELKRFVPKFLPPTVLEVFSYKQYESGLGRLKWFNLELPQGKLKNECKITFPTISGLEEEKPAIVVTAVGNGDGDGRRYYVYGRGGDVYIWDRTPGGDSVDFTLYRVPGGKAEEFLNKVVDLQNNSHAEKVAQFWGLCLVKYGREGLLEFVGRAASGEIDCVLWDEVTGTIHCVLAFACGHKRSQLPRDGTRQMEKALDDYELHGMQEKEEKKLSPPAAAAFTTIRVAGKVAGALAGGA